MPSLPPTAERRWKVTITNSMCILNSKAEIFRADEQGHIEIAA
jgi:hypothetical protein